MEFEINLIKNNKLEIYFDKENKKKIKKNKKDFCLNSN